MRTPSTRRSTTPSEHSSVPGGPRCCGTSAAHHLAIGRNVPLDHIAAWLTACARSGIVEFVQKSDPTVQLMLSTREDIFDTYTEEAFAAALARHARIVERRVISAAGRTLFLFETASL
jgi:hypothetical protein